MRKDVDHLPAIQQGELERVQGVLMEEFAEAIGRATTESRKNGKILKIILFGSYARNDWVDEPENGYQSDFDLLVVVNHDDLTDIAHYWYVAEDRILRDAAIARPGQHHRPFARRGEPVAEARRVFLGRYRPGWHHSVRAALPSAGDADAAYVGRRAYNMANAYFAEWLKKIDSGIKLSKFAIQENEYKDAAFLLHQTTERAYICFLLVRTLYFPRSHNIKFLRSLAEDSEPRLIDAWPRERRLDRRRFQLLKRAYVEARYSTAYEITVEELNAILDSVRQLRGIVEQVSRERLDHLRSAAGL